MSFLDNAEPAAEEAGPPATPQQGAGGAGMPQGGGPLLASLAGRQRGSRVTAPGQGDMASSLNMLTTAIGMIQQALPGLQLGTPVQQDALKALQRLSKHVPQGAPTVGVQRTHLEDLLRNIVKNALLQRIMGQRQQQGGAGQPPGAMQQAPMPSTPLPGA